MPVFCIVDTGSCVLPISNTITHLLESETKLALGDALTALALGLLHPVNSISIQFNFKNARTAFLLGLLHPIYDLMFHDSFF